MASLTGRASLTILALHTTAFKLVGLAEIWRNHLPIWQFANFVTPNYYPYWFIPFTIVGVGVPLVVYAVFERLNGQARTW